MVCVWRTRGASPKKCRSPGGKQQTTHVPSWLATVKGQEEFQIHADQRDDCDDGRRRKKYRQKDEIDGLSRWVSNLLARERALLLGIAVMIAMQARHVTKSWIAARMDGRERSIDLSGNLVFLMEELGPPFAKKGERPQTCGVGAGAC